MVHRLLLAAALVAAAAAVGEYDKKLEGCGCASSLGGNDFAQTYNLTSGAYCPTTSFPTCDISKMTESACTITCAEPRAFVVYRNNSAIWSSSKSVTCENGGLKNAEGKVLWNLLRPTCGYKSSCDNCNVAYHQDCPTGMTCKESNLEQSVGADDCGRLACKAGTLKLYDTLGAPMTYSAKQLFCTVASKWSNYSVDGSTVGGTLLNEPFTANCVLPKTCEACIQPRYPTGPSEIPEKFIGFERAGLVHFKEEGSCSTISCPAGFTLYGFTNNASTATGLEHTSRKVLQCDVSSQWTNGGYDYLPANAYIDCLKPAPPTTTANPCGAFDEIVADGGASFVCKEGQNRVECANNKKIEIHTLDETLTFAKLTFVAGKGWLGFDCDGNAKLYKTAAEISIAVCEGFTA